jgi:hypothetical protein
MSQGLLLVRFKVTSTIAGDAGRVGWTRTEHYTPVTQMNTGGRGHEQAGLEPHTAETSERKEPGLEPRTRTLGDARTYWKRGLEPADHMRGDPFVLELVLSWQAQVEVNQQQEIVCPHRYMVVRRQTDEDPQ